MFAERYLERRYQEGVAVGEETGRAKGERSTQQRWEAWNRRRVEAAARNEAFNEPTPALDLEDED